MRLVPIGLIVSSPLGGGGSGYDTLRINKKFILTLTFAVSGFVQVILFILHRFYGIEWASGIAKSMGAIVIFSGLYTLTGEKVDYKSNGFLKYSMMFAGLMTMLSAVIY
jgi:hypothetical protein